MTRRNTWALDDDIHFLNHGSFGATPRAVLARQLALRERLEAEPVRFMVRELEPLLDTARTRLASFLGARAGDLVFVPNATTGVNAVLRSLELKPGDELVTTSHGYNACTNVLRFVAERAGARVVVADVPFPIVRSSQLDEALEAVVNERTRLVLVDQITSPTALVFQLDALIARLEDRGIPVLVDAAHAPGHVAMHLDLSAASFTTGNLHKWVCAPKGCAFLHVRADRQPHVRPAIISHGANSPRIDRSRFQLEFDWVGTTDPTPFVCVPEALDVMGTMVDGGWPALMALNQREAVSARRLLLDSLEVDAPCPESMLGAMASVVLPWTAEPTALAATLFDRYQVEVPVIPFAGKTLVRISMQRHVRAGDVEALCNALAAVRPGRRV